MWFLNWLLEWIMWSSITASKIYPPSKFNWLINSSWRFKTPSYIKEHNLAQTQAFIGEHTKKKYILQQRLSSVENEVSRLKAVDSSFLLFQSPLNTYWFWNVIGNHTDQLRCAGCSRECEWERLLHEKSNYGFIFSGHFLTKYESGLF